MNFVLDPRLESDSEFICDLNLSQVRLNLNAAFPWIILIPKKSELVELIDLEEADQTLLWHEMMKASHVIKTLFNPKKLNVAALGNMVSQLHIHVIARFAEDKAWPNPVWNSGATRQYEPTEKESILARLKLAFEE